MSREEALKGAVAYFDFLKSIGLDYVQPAPPTEIETKEEAKREATPPPVSTPQKRGEEKSPAIPLKAEPLEAIRKEVENCTACDLSRTRNRVVFGTGNPNAKIMFVGEAPGADEDEQGKPFVGRAGQLLTKMIEAINFKREDLFIANILKCRPPENRDPKPEEVAVCENFLVRQIKAINPLLICTLGTHATQTLLKSKESIGRLRGEFHDYHGVPLLPTYHPSFLLRSPSFKKQAWEDLQLLRDEAKKSAK